MRDIIESVALVSGVALPLFNIPLILRLLKRKSSQDMSLVWAVGVWVCIVLMMPQGLRSSDIAFKSYSVVNICFFSVVAFLVLKYRFADKQHRGDSEDKKT